ncbi:hypothetical protein [Caenimonas sedimenti]|nr:hypothetical protein [Caenimonas sedimenti]
MPTRSSKTEDRPQGQTLPVQGEKQERVPRQPHERDESADSQAASEPNGRAIGKIAHDDLAEGQVDTDKGPVLDATYDKVREGASQPVKQFRP